MKTILHLLTFTGLSLISALAQFPNFPAADLVLGVPDFETTGNGASLPSRMGQPMGLAIDPLTRKVFVTAQDQNRVLRFARIEDLNNGANAEAVLGQINFSSTGGAPTQTGLNQPSGLHVDGLGRLWVADYGNNRVLLFLGASTLANGAAADRVYGQPDFNTTSADLTNSKMDRPNAVYVDDDDNLWVADQNNHRILRFSSISNRSNGAAAFSVLGQLNFTSKSTGTTNAKFDSPSGLTLDAEDRLWVVDRDNHRVLRFDDAANLASGSAASGVLGQPDFTSNGFALSAQNLEIPVDLLTDDLGTLWVVDSENSRVVSRTLPRRRTELRPTE